MSKFPPDCLPRCGTCAFIDIEPKDSHGYCRRYPPMIIIIADEACSSTPVVAPDEWCGEFKRRTS